MRPSKAESRESRWAWAVPLAALAAALAIAVLDPFALRGIRNATFDQYQRWNPRSFDNPPVRIVDIDDESLHRLGQWPWSRDRVAQLLTAIDQLKPASTALDVMFPEPDRTSLRAPSTGASASDGQDTTRADDELARVMARSNVAIGFAMSSRRAAEASDALGNDSLRLKASFFAPKGDAGAFVPDFPAIVSNLPAMQEAAAGQGAMTFIPDDDGIVRQVPLLMSLDGRLVPSLVAEALRLAAHERSYTVNATDNGGGVIDVRIGARDIATDATGALWIHYSKPHPERYLPAWRVLAHQVPADSLKGCVVLVGTSAQGLLDLRFSPLGGVVPGVEIHAQAIEQVLSGQRLDRPGWTPALELIVMLVGGLVVATLAMTRSAALSTAGFFAIVAALWGLAWRLFVDRHVLVDPTVPTLGMALVFAPATLTRHLLSERRQRWMRQAFSRYVSPNLVDYLIAHPEALELGGKRQRCSFVFADLAGFTSLMEKMDPTAAVSVLNGYLNRMIAIAFEHGGTLDRIVGDAIAIVFSAPIEQADHERRALECALAMHAFARSYVDDLARQGTAFCETRIGVHSGEVTVGNFGGGAIFDYRALGDPVNVAARLEGANKHLGTLICVSEATLSACRDMPARPIGRLRLAGRTELVMAHEPLLKSENGAAHENLYRQAFELMVSGSDLALAAFAALAETHPEDPLVRLYGPGCRTGHAAIFWSCQKNRAVVRLRTAVNGSRNSRSPICNGQAAEDYSLSCSEAQGRTSGKPARAARSRLSHSREN